MGDWLAGQLAARPAVCVCVSTVEINESGPRGHSVRNGLGESGPSQGSYGGGRRRGRVIQSAELLTINGRQVVWRAEGS